MLFLLSFSSVSANFAGTGDRTATRDTLTISFFILDTLGNPVDDATGDSVFITVTSTAGVEVFSDSMLFSDGRITEYLVEDYGNMYSFSDRISVLDGISSANGSFSYLMLVHDQSLGLQTPYFGNFQIINSTFDAVLDSSAYAQKVWDSLAGISLALDATRDSLQFLITATGFSTHSAADVWAVITRTLTTADWTTDADLVLIAKEASLFDFTTDNVIVGTNNDKTGYTLTVQDWSTHSASDVWSVVTRALTDKIGFTLTQEEHGAIADSTLDEVNTGATHNIENSLGRQIRETSELAIIRRALAQAGTANTITLDASASATDGAYDPAGIFIVDGTGAGQTRLIYQYDGTTKIAVVDRDWKVTPDATSEFIIYPDAGREHVNEGLAQAGANSTITLNTLASSLDDAYNGQLAFLRAGTGEDQVKEILDYNGTTKVATIRGTWGTNPDATTSYVILPFASTPDTSDIKTMMLNIVVSDTLTGTYLSQSARQTNGNVFSIDTLFMYLGYNSTSSRSTNGTSADADTLHIFEGATEIRRLIFHHIGGAAGDAPDSVTVAL